MLIASKREASWGFSSTLTLTTLRAPARSAASWARTGSTIRQGPHHGAQKSTRTGTLASVSAAKLPSSAGTTQGRGALHLAQRGVPRATGPIRFFAPHEGQARIVDIAPRLAPPRAPDMGSSPQSPTALDREPRWDVL